LERINYDSITGCFEEDLVQAIPCLLLKALRAGLTTMRFRVKAQNF